MDPELAQLLVAVAGGAGGEMGRQLWSAFRALVHSAPGGSSDEDLAALEASPDDQQAADALLRRLEELATSDREFAARLADWRSRARTAAPMSAPGDVHNEFSGGTATVLAQGRDFENLTIGLPPKDATQRPDRL